MSAYQRPVSPEEIISCCPVIAGSGGSDFGTLTQTLATWVLGQGFDVTMVSCDFQILDLSWSGMGADELIDRLEAVKGVRVIENLGGELSQVYVQSYIDFLKAGGELVIRPWIDAQYIYECIERGPMHFAVAAPVLNEEGRLAPLDGRRGAEPNDATGAVTTHSIVVHGVTDEGRFEVSDPWRDRHGQTFEPAHLISAFMAASFMCDNLFFQIRPRLTRADS